MPASAKPVWFITGCSTGFGRELAKILLSGGYRAVVTARNPAEIQDFVRNYPDTGLALALDVAQPEQIESAATPLTGISDASTFSSTTPATVISRRSKRATTPTSGRCSRPMCSAWRT
jgi:hypothetical protein